MLITKKVFYIFIFFIFSVFFFASNFGGEEFPFSRMILFADKPNETCNLVVLDDQNQIIPTGNIILLEEIQNITFAHYGNESDICSNLKKARYEKIGSRFQIQQICHSLTSPNKIQQYKQIVATCK